MTTTTTQPTNVLTLEDPITVDGKTLAQLTIRKPKVRDIRLARKSSDAPEDVEQRLLANLCELPPEAIDDLSLADYVRLQGKVTDFLPKELLGTTMTSVIG
jgi:hypothetical protein